MRRQLPSFGDLRKQDWQDVIERLPLECPLRGRARPLLAFTSPHLRELLQRQPNGLVVGGHQVRVSAQGDECEEDIEDLGSMDMQRNSFECAGKAASISPRKLQPKLPYSSSSYANDHSRLRLLEGGPSTLFTPLTTSSAESKSGHFSALPAHPQEGDDERHEPYELSLAFSVLDSIHAEHQRSLWWIRRFVKEHGMFLRAAGFRGRGCHTFYVRDTLLGVNAAGGSLLSLEISGMWFFTVFLDTLAKTTETLVELEHLSLQDCRVFPTMEETVGELISRLPSLRSITLHQFDFSLGRAKQILEAASEHACLRHINVIDNIFRDSAQSIVVSNVQAIRQLESFHINRLPRGFWNFGDFFAYKTNLRVLQLSHTPINDIAARDIGHCLNVAVMLEELHLSNCGITDTFMELLFPCIRRGGMPPQLSGTYLVSGDGTPSGSSPLMMPAGGLGFGGTSSFSASFGAPQLSGHIADDLTRSRTTSPAPALVQHLNVPPGSQSASDINLPLSVPPATAAGFGVNPFFEPSASPLQLPTMGSSSGVSGGPWDPRSPFSTPSMLTTHAGAPNFLGHTICATLPHLRVLNLSDNAFGCEGLQQLSAPLGRMESLEQLYLAGCSISSGDDHDAANVIFNALNPVAGGLFVLDLSRNKLGDRVIIELCDQQFFHSLSSNIAELFLGDVGISRSGVCALMAALQGGEWLALLDLSLNLWQPPQDAPKYADPAANLELRSPNSLSSGARFSRWDAVETFVEVLLQFLGGPCSAMPGPPLRQLKLNLSGLPLATMNDTLRRVLAGRDERHRVLSGEPLSGLTALALSSLSFGPQDDSATCALLVHNIAISFGRTLGSLDLSRIPLGDEVVSDILLCRCAASHSSQCVSCQLHTLASLHLRKTAFRALTVCPSNSGASGTGLRALTELDLSGNGIDRRSFRDLAQRFFCHLPLLQRLDLVQNAVLMPTKTIIEAFPFPEAPTERVESSPATLEDGDLGLAPAAQAVAVSETGEGLGIDGAPVLQKKSPADARSQGKDAGHQMTPWAREWLSCLQKRRHCVLDDFFPSLALATEACRGSLKRLKLDANGLAVLNLNPDMISTRSVPQNMWIPSAELSLVNGPLCAADWQRGATALPTGVTWDVYLLFSAFITSS